MNGKMAGVREDSQKITFDQSLVLYTIVATDNVGTIKTNVKNCKERMMRYKDWLNQQKLNELKAANASLEQKIREMKNERREYYGEYVGALEEQVDMTEDLKIGLDRITELNNLLERLVVVEQRLVMQ